MPWARIDDTFYDHPKVESASLAALGVYLLSLSWCNRHLTDGAIATASLRRIRGTPAIAKELVRVGLWEPTDTGWLIHDFLKYSKARSKVESDRARWAKSKRDSREDSTQDSAETPSVPFPLPSPGPNPAPSSSMEQVGTTLQRLVPRPS